jgi:LysM repeat protein
MPVHLKSAAGLIATFSVALLASTDARAQSPCAGTYVMQPGDTLYEVTQQCRVRLPDLMAANPQIDDIDSIPVGTRLDIPGASGARAVAPEPNGTHVISPGDTLFSLAEDYGTTVDALLQDNPGLDMNDLSVGLSIRIPGIAPYDDYGTIAPPRTIAVAPRAAGPGAPVTVSGANYVPGRFVEIGVGPPESEWRSLERTRVRADGEVETIVRVPASAVPGEELVYVIQSRDGHTEVSRPIEVVDRRRPGSPDEGEGVRTETGRLEAGTECMQLATPDGLSFSLVGLSDRFMPGDHVRVTGETADMSFCMQGAATIEVENARRVAPDERL